MATFSEMQPYLRQGMTVYRVEWPEGLELYLVPGSTFTVSRAPLNAILPEGTEVTYEPHYDQINADNVARVWSPTQEDLMTNDWHVGFRGWTKHDGSEGPEDLELAPVDIIVYGGPRIKCELGKNINWSHGNNLDPVLWYRKSPGWKPDNEDAPLDTRVDVFNRKGQFFRGVLLSENPKLRIKFWRPAS